MPLGDDRRVNVAVAMRVRAGYVGSDHEGAYRRYRELMLGEPSSPPICEWYDFAAWWEQQEVQA